MSSEILSAPDGRPACMDGYPTPCWLMECPGGLMHAHSVGVTDGKPVVEGRCETCGRPA